MSERLPILIDPVQEVAKQAILNGMLPLAKMPRLAELLVETLGDAEIELTFRQDGNLKVIAGQVKALLSVECQRCLQPLRMSVLQTPLLALVRSDEEAKQLPNMYDPLLLENQEIALSDLIEDELILAIPVVPRHKDCESSPIPGQQAEIVVKERENPFAVLNQLVSPKNTKE